jgi:hypothetical protein
MNDYEFWVALATPLAIGTVMQQIVGGLYYGPLFGETFIRLSWKNKKPTGSMSKALAASLIGAFLMNVAVLVGCVIANVKLPVDGKPIIFQKLILIKGAIVGSFLSLVTLGSALIHAFWGLSKHFLIHLTLIRGQTVRSCNPSRILSLPHLESCWLLVRLLVLSRQCISRFINEFKIIYDVFFKTLFIYYQGALSKFL